MMDRMKQRRFAALLAFALCAIGTVAWADVKIDAANFPDEKFRQWVKENAAGGGDVLTDAQIAAAEEVDVSETSGVGGISSLKGLEHFTALNRLVCSSNALTELDLSGNGALETLVCSGNELAKLDLSGNGALEWLVCDQNELAALDLSGLPELGSLWCRYNALTALDLSRVPALVELDCRGNEIAKLDLSRNPKLFRLNCLENPIKELDLSKNEDLSEASLPETAAVTLPNGDRIDMADFQLRRTAAGKYQLDLSRYAGKIEKVWVRSSGVVDEDVPVTSSGGIYTFDPCIGYGGIIYKLGRREGEDWTLELLLDSITPENIGSVPLVEAKAKADPNATEDIIEDAGGKPKAQAKTGYVLRGGKAYRVDGGKEKLLANVEPHGVRTEAGLWAWIMIDPETDGMESSESGVQFFLGEDAKPAGFLPVEDVEVCAVRFSSLGDKLLTVVGTGARQDVGLYLVDAANGGFVKKRSFASMGPVAWVDVHRFFFSAIDESKGFVGGHEGIWWASPSLYDTAEDEAIVIRKATATRNSAIIDYDPEAGTLTIMEMSVEDEKDWPDEDKVEFQELTLSIPAAG